jgi:hypothetical protein
MSTSSNTANSNTTGTTGVIVPSKGAELKPADAVAATKMSGGGLVLSPLPLNGGKRKSRKVSKKVIKMLKKMSKKDLKKLMKGGTDGNGTPDINGDNNVLGGKKHKTRKNKKSRKHSMLY